MDGRRFVSNILPQLQDTNCNLQSIYEGLPILPLDKVVESVLSLVLGVTGYVSTAKQKCNRDVTGLTWDESAAIYLYTIPGPLFAGLNTALRNPDRQLLRPWLPYLKLLTKALKKLPDTKATVWRGVNYDSTLHFVDNGVYTWWGITSCSKSVNIVKAFIGESGTLFTIETVHGKDITKFSAISDEEEVVLLPATRVRAKSEPAHFLARLFVIHLEEIYPQR